MKQRTISQPTADFQPVYLRRPRSVRLYPSSSLSSSPAESSYFHNSRGIALCAVLFCTKIFLPDTCLVSQPSSESCGFPKEFPRRYHPWLFKRNFRTVNRSRQYFEFRPSPFCLIGISFSASVFSTEWDHLCCRRSFPFSLAYSMAPFILRAPDRLFLERANHSISAALSVQRLCSAGSGWNFISAKDAYRFLQQPPLPFTLRG